MFPIRHIFQTCQPQKTSPLAQSLAQHHASYTGEDALDEERDERPVTVRHESFGVKLAHQFPWRASAAVAVGLALRRSALALFRSLVYTTLPYLRSTAGICIVLGKVVSMYLHANGLATTAERLGSAGASSPTPTPPPPLCAASKSPRRASRTLVLR